MAWDLTYSRNGDPGWLPWVGLPLPAIPGLFPAWMTYYVYRPNALVNGWFTVSDGVNPDVTYEFHRRQRPPRRLLQRSGLFHAGVGCLDYKQPGLSVHLLHPHGPVYGCTDSCRPCTPGNLRLFCDGSPYEFVRPRETIEILYEETAFDLPLGIRFPNRINLLASYAAGNALDLVGGHAQHIRVYADVPDPFADNLTYKILANFSRTFYEASSATTVDILGDGFADWGSPPFTVEP